LLAVLLCVRDWTAFGATRGSLRVVTTCRRPTSSPRTGRHAEAGEVYERLAKRPFFGPDTRLSLLAAREYLAAGRVDDAARLATQAERRRARATTPSSWRACAARNCTGP